MKSYKYTILTITFICKSDINCIFFFLDTEFFLLQMASSKINNTINDFHMLSNLQFVENVSISSLWTCRVKKNLILYLNKYQNFSNTLFKVIFTGAISNILHQLLNVYLLLLMQIIDNQDFNIKLARFIMLYSSVSQPLLNRALGFVELFSEALFWYV